MFLDPFGNDIPAIDQSGFYFGVTSDGPKEPEPDLGVLGMLENKTFKGQGFNTIFRPRSDHPLEGKAVKGHTDDNDLQLNLTVETIAFGSAIGRVPNRGLKAQDDILLGGITYMDSVFDVTNEATGKGDLKNGAGIHVEPGIWMAVPGGKNSGAPEKTLCRMASIPHGATINAQGQPSLTPIPGAPTFGSVSITPFDVSNDKTGKHRFDSQTLGKGDVDNRTPSNLTLFEKMGTITQEILDNPNIVLAKAIEHQKIANFIPFEVNTEPTKDFDGGGTANIAFLGTDPEAPAPQENKPITNAFVPSVKATFWIETVEYTFTVKGGELRETTIRPAGEFGPTFKVPPTLGRSSDTQFTVNYLQLQYTQTVLLNFFTLSWPHVSVATLGEQTVFNLALPPVPTNIPKPGCKPTPNTGTGKEECGTNGPDPREKYGQWEDKFDLQNVAVHASLLPNGKVLYWGRREHWDSKDPNSMSEHFTKTFLWDPLAGKNGESRATQMQPTLSTGKKVNLFCSGHCLQPDGTLFVVGGHLQDGHGVNQACVYDPRSDTWTPRPRMNNGRWYPSALTLNDGSTLAISGSYYDDTDESTPMNDIPQIWRKDAWISMPRMNDSIQQSFPRLHLDPHGRIFMAGPQAQSQFLDLSIDDGVGAWTTDGPTRDTKSRDYGPSVQYDSGKIMFIGGGQPPTEVVEFVDLNEAKPMWKRPDGTKMNFARRQHNATVLPDGSVLVTGGTSGGEFNDVGAQAVHTAELWDPLTMKWTLMDKESVDRCYHSIALLLPDGRVLSAGGGEWSPLNNGVPNDPAHSHNDAQLYNPPYLFKGARPTVSSTPTEVDYKQEFEVTVGTSDKIAKVSWVRLGSVTHACNMNQSLTFLKFEQHNTSITVHAPADAYVAPPGHYMLFLLNDKGVPSVAPIIGIGQNGIVLPRKKPKAKGAHTHHTARPKDYKLSLPARNEKIMAEQEGPAVAVGLTPSCPYGLGPCWGGAFDGLRHISDIDVVRPVPDQDNSIAYVYLKQDILPDIDVWRSEFEQTTNKSYHIRGIELKLSGVVSRHHVGTDEQLILSGTKTKDDVVLTPFYQTSKLEWDRAKNTSKPATEAELGAWARLSAMIPQPDPDKPGKRIQATGRLHKHGAHKFSLDVRDWKLLDNVGTPNGI